MGARRNSSLFLRSTATRLAQRIRIQETSPIRSESGALVPLSVSAHLRRYLVSVLSRGSEWEEGGGALKGLIYRAACRQLSQERHPAPVPSHPIDQGRAIGLARDRSSGRSPQVCSSATACKAIRASRPALVNPNLSIRPRRRSRRNTCSTSLIAIRRVAGSNSVTGLEQDALRGRDEDSSGPSSSLLVPRYRSAVRLTSLVLQSVLPSRETTVFGTPRAAA
jgi:hypothetical protein